MTYAKIEPRIAKHQLNTAAFVFLCCSAGPWRCELRARYDNEVKHNTASVIVRPSGSNCAWIADCGDMFDPERVANGRLIAAAPELFQYVLNKALKGDEEAQHLIEDIVSTDPVVAKPVPAPAGGTDRLRGAAE